MAYNPFAPVAAPPSTGYGFLDRLRARAQRGGVEGANERLLQEAGAQGVFDPRGNQLIRRQVRAHALRTARNRLGRGGVLSRIRGLDPQQARVAQLNFERDAGRDIQNTLDESDIGEAQGAQGFLRSLYSGGLERASAERIAREQRKAAEAQSRGQVVGGLGGAAIGKWF